MKTILEWYEELPEPIRSQAIANYDPSFYNEEQVSSISYAIYLGFNWWGTPKSEGLDYWVGIGRKADNGVYNKPQPPLEQSLSDLTKTLEEMKEAIESVRKAIGNER
jgi:hypothetical protein